MARRSSNVESAYRALVGIGLTPAQAAGAVGALTGESGPNLDPSARNPSSGAIGIGQWLGGRASGVRPGDFQGQLRHLIGELRGSERGAFQALRRAKTPEQAADIFTRTFERPSAGEIASSIGARKATARSIFNQLHGVGGASLPGGGGSTVTVPGSPSADTSQGGGIDAAVALLQQAAQQKPVIQSAGLTPPAFAAAPAMPQAYQAPPSGGGPQAPGQDLSAALALIAGSQGQGATPDAQQGGGQVTVGGSGGGGQFGKAHSPLLELIHKSGSGPGYAVKNGQVVSGPQVYGAVWDGHADHVHVAAGPKTVVQLGKLAQQMGLSVGENPKFGGVNPVHAKNSYHYRGEAIDVSGDPRKMDQFAARVERLYGLQR